jgi:hypothetical protein
MVRIDIKNILMWCTNKNTGPVAGDAASSVGGSVGDSTAGASGTDTGSISLSRGGVIAIIVVACSVCIFGGRFRSFFNFQASAWG